MTTCVGNSISAKYNFFSFSNLYGDILFCSSCHDHYAGKVKWSCLSVGCLHSQRREGSHASITWILKSSRCTLDCHHFLFVQDRFDEHRRSVDKTNSKSKSATEYFLCHPYHCYTDMQLIQLELIHPSEKLYRFIDRFSGDIGALWLE